MDPAVVHVRPEPLIAAVWGGFAGFVMAMGVFLVVRSPDAFTLAFLAASAVALAYFLLQVAAPALFSVALDTTGITGRWMWRRIQVPWEMVRRASVQQVIGESVLQLELNSGQQFGLLLPVGADLVELHGTLASRLGVVSA